MLLPTRRPGKLPAWSLSLFAYYSVVFERSAPKYSMTSAKHFFFGGAIGKRQTVGNSSAMCLTNYKRLDELTWKTFRAREI